MRSLLEFLENISDAFMSGVAFGLELAGILFGLAACLGLIAGAIAVVAILVRWWKP